MIETITTPNVDDGVDEKRLAVDDKAFVTFEESETTVWILSVETNAKYRNRGLAKSLIAVLKAKGKKVVPGSFTEDGERFLSRYF